MRTSVGKSGWYREARFAPVSGVECFLLPSQERKTIFHVWRINCMHKYYGLNELREMFLTFFESKGHLRLPS